MEKSSDVPKLVHWKVFRPCFARVSIEATRGNETSHFASYADFLEMPSNFDANIASSEPKRKKSICRQQLEIRLDVFAGISSLGSLGYGRLTLAV